MEATLKATLRDDKGSPESRRLRSEGLLPAVVYGQGMESTSVYINAREFTNALKTEAGSNVILNIELGEKDKVTALARQIQRHPYKDEFVHVDLIKVDLTQNVEAEVQINYLGIPIGVKEEGGLVQTINNTLRISALPTNIPTSLDIQIAHLNVGENVIASDIELPEGVTLANEDDDSVMVIVTLPRAAVEEEEDLLGEGLEGEEGEADGESTEQTAGDDSSEESAE
ncbi:50S ribosomal protein L25 [Candidatus Actinomarina]|nr:50S ribosomal protein L25 [bacterium]MDA9640879.1 50S ribosomal protein L25 [Candidatus Actinomarina sp.]MDA9676977.1 50S ribosomal protein L25 [bacterium]